VGGVFHETPLRIGKSSPEVFFAGAIGDADGAVAPRRAGARQGRTSPTAASPPHLVRPALARARRGRPGQGRRPCRRGGFRRFTIRGDTKFTQARHPDRRDLDDVRFIAGVDAMPNLMDLAGHPDDLKDSERKRPPSTRSGGCPGRPKGGTKGGSSPGGGTRR
jgi:hypothetical protein